MAAPSPHHHARSDDPSPLARWVPVRRVGEPRGDLTSIDFAELPFSPARVFAVTGCPPGSVRGGHAHTEGHQLLVCTRGEVLVELRRQSRRQVRCLPGGPGLLVPAGVWGQQTYATRDTTLLVVASHRYDPASYIDDDAQFTRSSVL